MWTFRPAHLVWAAVLTAFVGTLVTCTSSSPARRALDASDARPIKVGIVHSLTGTMAISERSVVDATLLAIDELNAQGGVLGRQVAPIVVDGQSEPAIFAAGARRLIEDEGVAVLFGCWTSTSRRTVRPIVELHDVLLFYPVQSEGLEQSDDIVYTGAMPNQQIMPAVRWASEQLGKRFFLVGSDYVFPHAANVMIRAQAEALGAEVVGEEYVTLGSKDVDGIVARIAATRPSVVLNTVNGDTNTALFTALRARGITPQDVPTLSFSLGENELRNMPGVSMAGDYAAWNYFQSIDSRENAAFVARFKARFGADRVVSDPMEAAYIGVRLWAKAVEDARSTTSALVRQTLAKQRLAAPEGDVLVDRATNHTWKTPRIGRIRTDGQFDVIWQSNDLVRPVPYPQWRSPREWEQDVAALQARWGGGWENAEGSTR